MKRITDKMRLDWLENRGYPGQFIKYDRKDKPWFDFETIGSDYSQTLREAIDAAIGAKQAASKPCCEPCPTGRCSPSAPCVCEVKPQATPKPEWKKPTVERKVCDCRNHERQVCDICTGVIFIDPKDRKDNPTTKPQATTGKECEVEPEAESPRCVCYDEPGSLSCPSCEKLNDRESR